jgi:hypothetical protein
MSEQRTVTVSAGPYATVRAVERARRIYGENVTVAGIVGPNWGRSYTYEVVGLDAKEPEDGGVS